MQKIQRIAAEGVFLVSFIISSLTAGAQTPIDPTLELLRLSNESLVRFEQRSKRAKEYAQKNNVPLSFKDSNGNLVLLVDVSDTGQPIYKATDNAGAAITTGVTNLQSGGELGLNLEGEGMIVGIWDGGSVSHSEFADRILNTEGSEADHPNHVAGTILAAGVNASARGMAPKASAYTFDFNNDESEMLTLARPDQTSLLLSNHSYGLITGWYFNSGWQWFGTASISMDEDYKFGFYSNDAAFWDQIAFNAPYYSIVKSAGNDRNNTGNGTRPPDCNGGAGYDCIGDVGTSKNIITVGAVNKVFTYSDAASVVMSTFSSWGPTDDGRIKPDLVAAGVNLFSSITQNNYGSLSGTSMSAPNTTGSLLLLQELYKNLHAGDFMRASTLKALAIHTTKEAGPHRGPDYRFGWGLLDVNAAAKVLLAEDDVNVFVGEHTITQGQTYELTLTPKPNEKITATIVWTDPAGTPVSASLDPTNIMLVNDLDVRIIDDTNEEQFPWILDPSDPDAAASKGDNIRDNVEKIEFETPEPRNYRLAVSHKGTLAGGSQNFSLILQYTSLNDPRTAYYWVGGSGDWNDPSKWSLASGGIVANSVPGNNDRIFVDENSFSFLNETISISTDISCGSLTWLANDSGSISLNDRILEINGSLIITSSLFDFSTSGIVKLQGSSSVNNVINLGNSDLSKASLLFEGQGGSWTIGGNGKIGSIILVEGNLIASGLGIELMNLTSIGTLPRSLDISSTVITELFESNLNGVGFTFLSEESTINLSADSPAIISWDGQTYNGELVSNGQLLQINGSSIYSNVLINGEVEFYNDNSISKLTIEPNSVVNLVGGIQLELSQNLTLESQPEKEILFSSFGVGTSTLFFSGYYKLCFDNLIVDGVDIEGTAVINAGQNSQITNSNDWLEEACENVLFPKFTSYFTCVGSLIVFTDETSGTVESWNWSFGDPASSENTSSKQNPYHVYSSVGDYEVTLTVTSVNDSRTYVKPIGIGENQLPSNHVIINHDDLFSFRAASDYQWYRDDEPIAGAVSRSYNFNGEAGLFFVLTVEGDCNVKSSSVAITDLEKDNVQNQVIIFPNPASNRITLSVPNELMFGSITLINSLGGLINKSTISENAHDIDLQGMPAGLYFLRIDKEAYSVIRKVVIER